MLVSGRVNFSKNSSKHVVSETLGDPPHPFFFFNVGTVPFCWVPSNRGHGHPSSACGTFDASFSLGSSKVGPKPYDR